MSKTTQTSSGNQPATLGSSKSGALAARLWTVALGLMLAAAGAATCWFLWAAYQKACETDHWVRTPCEVTGTHVDDSKFTQHGMVKFTLLVSYRYEFDGETRVSDKIKRLPVTSSSTKKIDKLIRKYPTGMQTTCLVNPDDPDDAILKPNTKAPLYTMWFPGIFVLGGIGIVIAGVRGRKSIAS